MRKQIVAGNWKMNKSFSEAEKLVDEVLKQLKKVKLAAQHEVIFAPPFISLKKVSRLIGDEINIFSAAQNCFWEKEGAYTGEVSAVMIASVGAKYVIIGHSERRQYFNEANEMLAKKINLALENELLPIYCVGEMLQVREEGGQFNLVEQQINEGLFHLTEKQIKNIVIAYEPVWAIGTGKNATKEQAQEMHALIRSLLEKKYGKKISDNISILYGGSCKPSNAQELFSQPDVDGGLIGGASLIADDFVAIIKSL
jgi:triosephosphate isomerase (TIM)